MEVSTTTDHIILKVELEIKVDGGGGEAGNEVANIAHQWIWRHGRKVQNKPFWSTVEVVKYQLRE